MSQEASKFVPCPKCGEIISLEYAEKLSNGLACYNCVLETYPVCNSCNIHVNPRYLYIDEGPESTICIRCHNNELKREDRKQRAGRFSILLTKEHMILDFIQDSGSEGRRMGEIQRFICEMNGLNYDLWKDVHDWNAESKLRDTGRRIWAFPGETFEQALARNDDEWIPNSAQVVVDERLPKQGPVKMRRVRVNRGYYCTNLSYQGNGILDRHCIKVNKRWVLHYLAPPEAKEQHRLEREERARQEAEYSARMAELSERVRQQAEERAQKMDEIRLTPKPAEQFDYSGQRIFGKRMIVVIIDEEEI